jgi:hypothetical protein
VDGEAVAAHRKLLAASAGTALARLAAHTGYQSAAINAARAEAEAEELLAGMAAEQQAGDGGGEPAAPAAAPALPAEAQERLDAVVAVRAEAEATLLAAQAEEQDAIARLAALLRGTSIAPPATATTAGAAAGAATPFQRGGSGVRPSGSKDDALISQILAGHKRPREAPKLVSDSDAVAAQHQHSILAAKRPHTIPSTAATATGAASAKLTPVPVPAAAAAAAPAPAPASTAAGGAAAAAAAAAGQPTNAQKREALLSALAKQGAALTPSARATVAAFADHLGDPARYPAPHPFPPGAAGAAPDAVTIVAGPKVYFVLR